MQENLELFANYDANVIAIAATPEDGSKMAERGVSFPLAYDPSLALATQYGVADIDNKIPFPATFIVDSEGFIRFVYVGEDMTDRPVLDSITTIVKHLSP